MKSRKSWLEMPLEEFNRELESLRPEAITLRNEKNAQNLYFFINGFVILAGMVALFYPFFAK